MRALEIARKLAQLSEEEKACQAYTLVLHESDGSAPEMELEAALYILQFGSGDNYKISYTVFRDLYNKGFCKEDILRVMDGAFYAPNIKLLQTRYRKNCALLEKYPYIFQKDFLKFEDLPIRFYPYDDNSYTPYYPEEERFGEYINPKETVIKHNFFKDLEKPVLAQDIYSQYELEYLRDNVRRSEDVARENHIYLHYSDWGEFCSFLACLNIRPLLEGKKLVFLFGDEIDQYPIDFKERFGIDYSQYRVQPIRLSEVTRLIWHSQLSSHNGGDLFNEVFDAHPNLIAMPSVMMSNIQETLDKVKNALNSAGSFAEAMDSFVEWDDPRLVEELYYNRNRTDKDILIAMYLYMREYNQFLDKNSRIAPALFFQPHFPNIVYSLKADAKDRATMYSEVYESVRTSPMFLGFKYIKTFTPMRRPTTSHGGTVRFMDAMASAANAEMGEDGTPTIISDAISERVLNRSFMIDRQDRIYRDGVLVRFEDGKLNPKATFTALAAFLDLPYTESLTYCSEKNIKDPHPETKGFDPVTVYRTYDEYVNGSERIFIEYMLRDAYQYYGYDFQYYDGKPMSVEQVKALLRKFDTMDSYIRKTWQLVFKKAMVSFENGTEDVKRECSVQNELLNRYMQDVLKNRENTVEILMSNLRFVGKKGQPLYMMPKLELDPALLEQPMYH